MTASQLATVLYGLLTLALLAFAGFVTGSNATIFAAVIAAALVYVFQGVQEFANESGVAIPKLLFALFLAPILVTIIGLLVLFTEI